jgi:cysteinyl-tRNA synthetase
MAIIMILSFAYFFQTISSCLKMSKSLNTFFTIDRSINLMQVTELAFFYIAS